MSKLSSLSKSSKRILIALVILFLFGALVVGTILFLNGLSQATFAVVVALVLLSLLNIFILASLWRTIKELSIEERNRFGKVNADLIKIKARTKLAIPKVSPKRSDETTIANSEEDLVDPRSIETAVYQSFETFLRKVAVKSLNDGDAHRTSLDVVTRLSVDLVLNKIKPDLVVTLNLPEAKETISETARSVSNLEELERALAVDEHLSKAIILQGEDFEEHQLPVHSNCFYIVIGDVPGESVNNKRLVEINPIDIQYGITVFYPVTAVYK